MTCDDLTIILETPGALFQVTPQRRLAMVEHVHGCKACMDMVVKGAEQQAKEVTPEMHIAMSIQAALMAAHDRRAIAKDGGQ